MPLVLRALRGLVLVPFPERAVGTPPLPKVVEVSANADGGGAARVEVIPPPRGEGRLHLAFATSESLESQGWGDSPRQTRSRHAGKLPPTLLR